MRPTLGPTFSLLLAKLREIGRDNNLLEDTTTRVGAKTPSLALLVIPLSHFFCKTFC